MRSDVRSRCLNLITGIADAMLDSVPMVCLTGQVPSSLLGTDAFQELDVFGLTMPIVKHSFWCVRYRICQAWCRTHSVSHESGRPGPVLIDLPKDVQMTDASHLQDHVSAAVMAPPQAEASMIIEAAAAIASAEKPVIYGGGGIALADAVNVFRTFVDTTSIPTTLTLRGLGALPHAHPHYLGMLGMHGTRAANMAIQE